MLVENVYHIKAVDPVLAQGQEILEQSNDQVGYGEYQVNLEKRPYCLVRIPLYLDLCEKVSELAVHFQHLVRKQ